MDDVIEHNYPGNPTMAIAGREFGPRQPDLMLVAPGLELTLACDDKADKP